MRQRPLEWQRQAVVQTRAVAEEKTELAGRQEQPRWVPVPTKTEQKADEELQAIIDRSLLVMEDSAGQKQHEEPLQDAAMAQAFSQESSEGFGSWAA